MQQVFAFLVWSGAIALVEAQLHVPQIPIHLQCHLHCLHAHARLVTMALVEAHAPLAQLSLTGSTLARELPLPTARFLAMLDTMAPA